MACRCGARGFDSQVRHLGEVRKSLDAASAPQAFQQFYQSVKAYDQMVFLIAHVLNEIQNGPVSEAHKALLRATNEGDVFFINEGALSQYLRDQERKALELRKEREE